MTEPILMEMGDAVVFHDMELAAHGGSTGLRDPGMLESAIMRSRKLWAYTDAPPSLTRIAAAYAFGISSNHPFVDGNKRTALVVSFAFLDTSGVAVTASQEDAYETILALAAGEIGEQQITEWFDRNTAPLQD
jgi:death-on-curing protein